MTSRWIKDLEKAIDNPDLFELYIEDKLKQIDELLRLAMYSVDDENLSDKIRKEINGTS